MCSGLPVLGSGQTCGMLCTGIFWLGTGNLQDELNLHTCYIYPCFCELFLYWFGGLCSLFFWCACFCLTCVFFFLYLPFGNSVHRWHIRLIWATWDPLPLVWCVLLWPLNFPSSWPVGIPCLWGTCQGPHCLHLLFWEQSPHLSEKKPYEVSWLYLEDIWQDWFENVQFYTTHLHFLYLGLKLVKRSKWALTSFTWGLQNSSKWSQSVSKLRSSLGRP